eukprot:CAMPEP_0168425054 /NCGR_PEP_ID=MMETSP0228-20121227/35131_1 /TAXON_ID=133427 /ORGANISM="Protoceratium reticulatum, Strain CCCM 535 (=CCMP 1889)" /LENGTH=502 /DNA_ID=CAMNT_0008439045 /DNA_START=61 /DNA_END=1567 /DNA_ORIENTATION=-
MVSAAASLSLVALCLQGVLCLRAGLTSHWSSGSAPVEAHGKLSVSDGKLVDQAGQPVRLRGMSLYSSQWGGVFYNASTVQWLAEDWHASVVRAAVAAEGGYLTDPAAETSKIETVVDAAVAAGIYVIIEWHDRHAVDNLEVAKGFFEEIASKYGGLANVLFEPYGQPDQTPWSAMKQYSEALVEVIAGTGVANVLFEPFGQPEQQPWPTMKQYSEAVVEVIRRHTDNLIILGTPHWGQDVDLAAEDPAAGANLAYALHFNAAVHGSAFQAKVSAALKKGVAVFCSEWTTGNRTSKGTVSFPGSQSWVDFMAANSISDVNWAIYDGKDAASALQGAGSEQRLARERAFDLGENCMTNRCCSEPGMQCYEKDAYFATCRPSCTPGIDSTDSPQYQTSWTCKALGGACTRSCATAGDNCKYSGCCNEKGMTCFEKDEFFSGCKATCEPGLDALDTGASGLRGAAKPTAAQPSELSWRLQLSVLVNMMPAPFMTAMTAPGDGPGSS